MSFFKRSFYFHSSSSHIFLNILYLHNFFLQVEIDQLKSKYTLLENESLNTINRLQCQITELNLQLKQQSAFSSIIGSTFGSYLWQATQIPTVAGMILQKVKNP